MWADKTKTFDDSALYIVEVFMEQVGIQCCHHCDIYFHGNAMTRGEDAYSDHDYCKTCYLIVEPTHYKVNQEILRRMSSKALEQNKE